MTDLVAYRDRLGEIGDETGERAASLVDRLDAEELAPVAAGVIMLGKSRTAALADVTLADLLAVQPLGLGPVNDEARLTRAVITITVETTEDDLARAARLRKLGRAEALTSAQDTWRQGLRRRGRRYWRRGTSGRGCLMCADLASRDTLLSIDTPMIRHHNCRCYQLPVEGPNE